MKLSLNFLVIHIVLLILGSIFLSACNAAEVEETATLSPSPSPESETTLALTPTTKPQTATPILTKTAVVLVVPSGADASLSDQIALTLSDLTSTEGLEFEVRTAITKDDLSPEFKLVAAVPPDPGLSELAQATPETQFLGILIPGLAPAENLTVIHEDEIRPDTVGFLAGYLAAVVTPEWRVGTISSNDSEEGYAHRQGFLNGAVFFCGLCRQTYPPFINYPLYAEAPTESNPQEWQTAANIMIENAVKTAYIAPEASEESLFDYLAEAEVNLIGTIPPPSGLEAQWIATIAADIISALRTVWPDLIAEQGGGVIAAPLSVTNINPELFSPGRQRLVEKLINEISAGFIDTGIGSNSP
jgi:hypothetical protein